MSHSQAEPAFARRSINKSSRLHFTLERDRLAAEALAASAGALPCGTGAQAAPAVSAPAAAAIRAKSIEHDDVSLDGTDEDDPASEDSTASSSDESFEVGVDRLFPCRTILSGRDRGTVPAQWVSVEQAAERLSVCERALSFWVKERWIASVQAKPGSSHHGLVVHLGNVSRWMITHLDTRSRRSLLRAAEARMMGDKAVKADGNGVEQGAVVGVAGADLDITPT